jgi:predicted dehydrogenase
MKQVVFRRGKAVVDDVPAPTVGAGDVLVRVAWSCLSPGTELAAVGTTSVSGMIQRLREDRTVVRKAMGVLRNRGMRAVGSIASDRLSTGIAPGYSCSGIVEETGEGVEGFAPGDAVACAGSGYASHAEVVSVPRNLVVAVPEGVDLADASTVTLGAIAMQGVRRAGVSVGERVGVIGLGMLGQLTVQLLKAAGCEVFGVDVAPARIEQARQLGLDMAAPDGTDPVTAAVRFGDGHGLDAVLITAATRSDEPLAQAMRMARRKGRVVVVGDVGLGARREEMYPKELDLLISTSYGPGRYDPTYEEGGLDYPYAYVRWTENRNMQAYLTLIASKRIRLAPLTTRRCPVDEAEAAYAAFNDGSERPYTVLLRYPDAAGERPAARVTFRPAAPRAGSPLRVALIGAGSFARGMHIPILKSLRERYSIAAVVTRHGHTASAVARQVGARWGGTDYRQALEDPDIDAVVISTRHDLHAALVLESMKAGKATFVEKPLALTVEELQDLEKAHDQLGGTAAGCPLVMVGFNRRYSPFALQLRELVQRRTAPLHGYYRMNAGRLPADHWVNSPAGGGRLIGEACHILDLFRFLVGAPAEEVWVSEIGGKGHGMRPSDNFTLTVRYQDGSLCTLLYTSQGSGRLAKEYLELSVDGHSAVLDDYRRLRTYGWGRDVKSRGQDKGHRGEWDAFAQLYEGRRDAQALWDEAVEVSRLAIEADRLLRG